MKHEAQRDLIVELHDAGTARDDIIVRLVTDGLTLNTATRLYAAVAKDNDWTSRPTSNKEGALEQLRELYGDAPETWDAKAVADAVVQFCSDYDIAESTARDYTKAFSEELDVPHPVRDYRTAIFEWFKDHDGEPIAEMKKAYIEFATIELGRSRSNANEYWKGYELHLYLSK